MLARLALWALLLLMPLLLIEFVCYLNCCIDFFVASDCCCYVVFFVGVVALMYCLFCPVDEVKGLLLQSVQGTQTKP